MFLYFTAIIWLPTNVFGQHPDNGAWQSTTLDDSPQSTTNTQAPMVYLPIVMARERVNSHISDFVSLDPAEQDHTFQLATSHTFQYLAEENDPHMSGETHFADRFDFTGYIPIDGSSRNGYIGLNHEVGPIGGVSILDVSFDISAQRWNVTDSASVSFIDVGETAQNCSGAVTPWNTLVSCEETIQADMNGDGYKDHGWCIEVDPASRSVLDQPGGLPSADKLWALGNFEHENVAIRPNHRTVYTGRDNTIGYLYRFVADQPQNLSSGKLYVYKALGDNSGSWIQLQNDTPEQRNTIIDQSATVNATPYGGIEEIEIGPDGMVYFAAKKDGLVYRFRDVDPLSGINVSQFEPYVGGQSYDIVHAEGTTSADWGKGNDNLAFDDRGNLWVLQDGGKSYIWVVEDGHTQAEPKVKLFGIAPIGAEATGITFTPDYRFLFMSIQHPSSDNVAIVQQDAFGQWRAFDKDVAIVIAQQQFLGTK